MARVLVTGSAGAVGQPVCAELVRRGHAVRGLDRRPTPWLDDAVVGDIADAEAVDSAMRDCDTLVHLAAHPDDAAFDVLLGPNVVGLVNVMNAARGAGVQRVALASSIQVAGRWWEGSSLPMPVATTNPSNHYALTKAWAETTGRMYARRFGMSVVAARLGWMVRNPREAEHIQRIQRFDIYLSRTDVGRFFANAVEVELSGFEVVYVLSAAGASCFDMEPARRLLDFEPRDRWPEGLGFEVPPLTSN